jgi:flagellar motility protein MotE (MotC chaperone)
VRVGRIVARIRPLPLAIFVLCAMLSVKLGSVWQGIELAAVGPTLADVSPASGSAAAKSDDAPVATPSSLGASAPALTEEEIAVLQKLAARREALDARERELELRQNLLAAAEKRIDAKLAELKKVQGAVTGLIKKHDEEEEAKLRQLVKMYEIMKPKEAALIFEKLEMPVLLDVVERMREQKSGPIIAKMDPGKAEKLTAALADRRALPKSAP